MSRLLVVTVRRYAWRGLCRRKMYVRPSIRPSVTCRYSVKTFKHILKMFHLQVATAL